MNFEEKKYSNSYAWVKNDLTQFLIKDYIEDMERMGNHTIRNILISNFQTTSQRYKKYKLIFNLIDKAYNNIFLIGTKLKNKKKKKILFVGNRYSYIISTAKKQYNVEMIVGGKEDRFFAIKHFIKYDSFSELDQLIYNYLIEENEVDLNDFLSTIKNRIKKINPDYVILWNDCLPVERAVVMTCKMLNIPTLEIQHGIYDSSFPLSTGKVVDYVLVWGEFFKDLYVKQNLRKSENIYVLGYPYLIEKEKLVEKKDNRYTVYYLGQNFKIYSKEIIDAKMESIKEINKICNKLGMNFVYRPHPGDNRQLLEKKLPDVCFASEKDKIKDSFADGDIFISMISTSLIEAAMRSKISLQLKNLPLNLDDFEKLGACDKTFESLAELENYLFKISKSKSLDAFKSDFNNNYIEIRHNSGEKFLEIIKNIKNTHYE